MVIDHIGVVVRSLEESIQRWSDLFGYKKSSEIVVNTRQKVKVVFLSKENSITIKLVEPSDASSPISRFARKGGGIHHLCFRCADMQAEIPSCNKTGQGLSCRPSQAKPLIIEISVSF